MEKFAGLREYSSGDEVRIKTVLDHEGSVSHIEYVFRNRQDPSAQAVIRYEVPEGQPRHRGDTGINRTDVELRWRVPADQASGPYLLESITATRFGGGPIDGRFDGMEDYAGFRIRPKSQDPAYASGWEHL